MNLEQVLSLARAGATEAAWELLEASNGDGASARATALRGRLLKDRAATATGTARAMLLREAGEAYAAAASGTAATYPLINAATLAFLGGARGRAETLAREALALLDGGAHEPDTRYWLGATRAEALLLLEREVEARAALAAAVAETPRAWEDHAATLRQFRLILAEQGRPADWLERFRPPPAVHFAGPIRIGLDDTALIRGLEIALASARPGSATGALAAGFDIVAAEALAGAGAELQVILPSATGAFVEASVRPYGAEWIARFDRLMAAASSVETLEEPAGLCDAAAAVAEAMALGSAIREAGLRGSETLALRMARDGRELPDVPAGVRMVEVAAGAASAPAKSLGLPVRPLALVGWTGAVAPNLGDTPVYAGHVGALVALADIREAAAIALGLFENGADTVALDFGAFGPDALDSTRVETLLAIAPLGYPVATRSAALALAAAGAAVQAAPAGEAVGPDGSMEYSSLWPARRPDRQAVAAK